MRQLLYFTLTYTLWCFLLSALYFGCVLTFAHIIEGFLPTIGDTPHSVDKVSVSVGSFMHIYEQAIIDKHPA
jgi:hypothetical protein